MTTFYHIAADFFLFVHSALIVWVVLGLLLTLIGGFCGWKWIRNPWFRWTHLLVIAIVVFESIANIECPLTTWENQCRVAAGMEEYERTGFIAHWLDKLLYFECDDVYFDWAYSIFGLLVVATFIAFPPRRFRARKEPAATENSSDA